MPGPGSTQSSANRRGAFPHRRRIRPIEGFRGQSSHSLVTSKFRGAKPVSEPSVVEDVFLAALAKSGPVERAAYLDAACQHDSELRRQVDRLLEAHPKAGEFLETPTLLPRQGTASYVPICDEVGAVIAGRYKLVEKIGEGGMGAVWVAQQTAPVKRVVAVKLIKAGMDSGAVLARFEAERQALALMDHPNIARVLDGGLHEGRPYFVM